MRLLEPSPFFLPPAFCQPLLFNGTKLAGEGILNHMSKR